MATVHAPDPEQAPDHPANWDPLAGVAVKVMVIPLLKDSVQSAPQLIPTPDTLPRPVPEGMTLKV
jgi:hypothetical protein